MTSETCSDQAIFDKVASHLLKKMERSTNFNGSCRYRGSNDLKCDIGCLIPDNKYNSRMEGLGINWLIQDYPFIANYTGANMGFLIALQTIHDSRRPKEWNELLRDTAVTYGLTTEALNVRN